MARGVAKTSNERVEENAVQSYNRFYLSYTDSGDNDNGYAIKGIDALNIYRKATDDKNREATLHPMEKIEAPSEIITLSNSIDSSEGTVSGAEYYSKSYKFTYKTDADGYIYEVRIFK